MGAPTLGGILRRGALAGVAAGVAASLVAFFVVEPVIERALAVEEARTAGEPAEEAIVGRAMQVFGGMVAALAVAICLALVLSVVFARVRHLLPGRTDFGRASLLAFLGFVAFALLPALKYPANPPAVGDPDTVDARTAQYLSLIAAGVAIAWLAVLVRQVLPARGLSAPLAVTLGVLTGVAGYAVLMLIWPGASGEIPADVSPQLIWDFRIASLAELAAMWATMGATLGLLLTPRAPRSAARVGETAATA
ncbi:putative cobalt transporter CbtA [Catenuloplanes nepalensis]|uniref:Cobalt transporter CbtA n=1 Tax=Catenuloplanes nepalensis TaxID=587533 RepID=A0ABT9MYL7_9ACTN|nr:CbtA family protein [Catenuloplanes nepalensis]MDP9796517.1 putative cobalt transporter CbtA [Catenuloplanes nepalensis]